MSRGEVKNDHESLLYVMRQERTSHEGEPQIGFDGAQRRK